LAAWLVARPHNAVLGLAATLLLPVLQIFSGIIMVLLVLKHGVRLAVIEAAIAAAVLIVVALVASVPAIQVVSAVVSIWLPAVLIGVALHVTRSVTLTMQVSVLVAAVATLAFYVLVGDLVAYWQPVATVLIDWARENSLHEQAQLMEAQPAMTADMLTMAVVLANWMLYAVYLLFGYRLFTGTPGETRNYGRFCDLNFGRVIALIMAVLSLLAFAIGAAWLQSTAFVLFAVFWLQGLAVVHWMYTDGHLPLFVVIITYVLMPILHVFLVIALAILGYTDAWFGYRRRAVSEQ
jgi:hypothetical protein